MSRFDQVMSVDKLIENDIHTSEDITGINVKNSRFISVQEALDAVEESMRLNHHKNAKEACAHEYEHRHFLKILMDIQPADVVPYSIEPDGTLTVTVPKGTKRIGRILIEEDGTQYGGMFYPDTGGCFLSSMERSEHG